jgi:hypothetical protein
MDEPKKPDERKKPAQVDDEEDKTMRREGFAGPDGQAESESPVDYDGGEVSGTTHGESAGRKPAIGG